MKVAISTKIPPEPGELALLFRQTTWAGNRSIEKIDRLIGNLDIFVTIRSKGRLIGFGRAVSDGTFRALVDDVVVDESYRGNGVGGMIMNALKEQLESIEMVFLNTRDHLREFYESFGFEEFGGCTMVSAPIARGIACCRGDAPAAEIRAADDSIAPDDR